MSADDLADAMRDLFLLADREGVTLDQLKRAIERLRETYRDAGRAALDAVINDD